MGGLRMRRSSAVHHTGVKQHNPSLRASCSLQKKLYTSSFEFPNRSTKKRERKRRGRGLFFFIPRHRLNRRAATHGIFAWDWAVPRLQVPIDTVARPRVGHGTVTFDGKCDKRK